MDIQKREKQVSTMSTLRGLNHLMNEIYKGKASISFDNKTFADFKKRHRLKSNEMSQLLEISCGACSLLLSGQTKFVSFDFLEKLTLMDESYALSDFINVKIKKNPLEIETLKSAVIIENINAILLERGISQKALTKGARKPCINPPKETIQGKIKEQMQKIDKNEVKRIVEAFTAGGYTVTSFAKKADISLSRLYNLKHGKRSTMSSVEVYSIYATLDGLKKAPVILENPVVAEVINQDLNDTAKKVIEVEEIIEVEEVIEVKDTEPLPVAEVKAKGKKPTLIPIEKLIFEGKIDGVAKLSPLNKYYLTQSIKTLIEMMSDNASEEEVMKLIKKIA